MSYVRTVEESMYKGSLRLVAKACSRTRSRSVELIAGRDLVRQLTLPSMCHMLGPRQGSRSINTSTIREVLRGLTIHKFHVTDTSILT